VAQNTTYITETELTGDLKNLYSDIRQELVPIITPLVASMQKIGPSGGGRAQWGGNNLFFDVVTQAEVNWSYSTTGQLPYSTDANEVQGNVGITRFYVTRQFDNLAIVGTQSKQAAFISLREKITRAFAQALQLGMEESLNGNATGVKAVIMTAASTTSIVLRNPYGVDGAGPGGLWIKPNMYITVYDPTGATNRGTAKISAVGNVLATATGVCTATLATAISNMASADIVVAANLSGDALNAYCNGLVNLTNRGGGYTTLHAISAATYGNWDSLKFTAGSQVGTTAQEMDIWTLSIKLFAQSGFNATMSPKDYMIVTTYGIGKQLIQSVLGQRTMPTTPGGKIGLPGGYEVESILGIPLVMDPYCPLGTLYLLHLPSLQWVDAMDWSPVQYENSGAVRFVDGADAFNTSFKQYFNVMTRQRNALASIISYTDGEGFNWVRSNA
jgi:hypothetical protein